MARRRQQRRAKLAGGALDERRIGWEYGTKIAVKAHCPQCGRFYRGRSAKLGVHVCGVCKRRDRLDLEAAEAQDHGLDCQA